MASVFLSRFFLLLVLFSSFVLVYAGSSDTDSIFIIKGCNFQAQDGDNVYNIGVSPGECSSGDFYGLFFCSENAIPYLTTEEEGLGCSRGVADYDYTNNEDFCCPSGMFCNETSPGLFKCNSRLMNCSSQENPTDCKNNGCIWMDAIGECTDNPRNYDCGYYDTEESCLEDKWRLGSSGLGTELCGTSIECGGKTIVIPKNNCSCKWYGEGENAECQSSFVAMEQFYSVGSEPIGVKCSNVFSVGDCIDGLEDISWLSTSDAMDGGALPPQCLTALGCNNGATQRECGEPIIKLSFFSLFSLVASVLIIAGYYLLSGKFKYNRGFSFP